MHYMLVGDVTIGENDLVHPTVTAERAERRLVDDRNALRIERAREEVGFWPSGLAVNPSPNGASAIEEEGTRSYGHIVVDEAQDLSPLQLRMLARRSISGSMTVVGDIAQATGPWAPSSWDDVAAYLTPHREPRRVELTVGYRTPAEVMAVAAPVLALAAPDLTPPRPVRRSGSPPSTVTAEPGRVVEAAAEAAVAELRAAGTGRTAVLVPEALAGDVIAALSARGVAAVDPRDPGVPGGDWQRARTSTFGAADLLWLFGAPGDDPARALLSSGRRAR